MKTTLKTGIMLWGITLIISSCDNVITPSSVVTTQERAVSDFNGLEIGTAFDVEVRFSSTEEKVEIETNENIHAYVEVEKVNNILRIQLENGTNINGNLTLKARITTSTPMAHYSASGASHIRLIDHLEADNVNLSLTGASFFTGSISANVIDAYLDGASNASLAGTATDFVGSASGASFIHDYSMVVDNADLNLSGASNCSMTVNKTIDLVASGGSVLQFKGTATVGHLDLSGGSQIVNSN